MDKIQQGFLGNENKALLWSLLQESGAFGDIHPSYLSHVKRDFETALQSRGSQMSAQDSLMGINKKAMGDLLTMCQKYKNKTEPKKENSPANISYLQKDISKAKQDKFSADLNKHQNDFTNLMHKKKPSEPNFEDKADEPFDNSSIGNLLSETQARREAQLNAVLNSQQDNNEATDWIHNKNKITIGENAKIQDNTVLNVQPAQSAQSAHPAQPAQSAQSSKEEKGKRVSFQPEPEEIQLNSFLNKLKPDGETRGNPSLAPNLSMSDSEHIQRELPRHITSMEEARTQNQLSLLVTILENQKRIYAALSVIMHHLKIQ